MALRRRDPARARARASRRDARSDPGGAGRRCPAVPAPRAPVPGHARRRASDRGDGRARGARGRRGHHRLALRPKCGVRGARHAGDPAGRPDGARLGEYEVGRLLGRGGMGEVYEARDRRSGRRVACKVIRPEGVGDAASLAMFRAELEALGRARSAHVPRVLDAGGADHGVPFLVMEFVEGRSLAEILRERDRLEVDEVLALGRDLALGLHDMHRAGVLHCDVKPQNVLWSRGGRSARWVLVDLGIAALGGDAKQRSAGTPGYMSPEQALGEAMDARSDLYALGCVLFRAWVGRPAWSGDDPVRIAWRARMLPPPDAPEIDRLGPGPPLRCALRFVPIRPTVRAMHSPSRSRSAPRTAPAATPPSWWTHARRKRRPQPDR
ncbi:MAG: serine/threonine protein kinase [Myxococcota bacterium]|nr:serine/threonine protein kinase [Myxococcota bacterium]MDW8361592.1 serine/threonine-protein kinase [Myxococcales bacterium]